MFGVEQQQEWQQQQLQQLLQQQKKQQQQQQRLQKQQKMQLQTSLPESCQERTPTRQRKRQGEHSPSIFHKELYHHSPPLTGIDFCSTTSSSNNNSSSCRQIHQLQQNKQQQQLLRNQRLSTEYFDLASVSLNDDDDEHDNKNIPDNAAHDYYSTVNVFNIIKEEQSQQQPQKIHFLTSVSFENHYHDDYRNSFMLSHMEGLDDDVLSVISDSNDYAEQQYHLRPIVDDYDDVSGYDDDGDDDEFFIDVPSLSMSCDNDDISEITIPRSLTDCEKQQKTTFTAKEIAGGMKKATRCRPIHEEECRVSAFSMSSSSLCFLSGAQQAVTTKGQTGRQKSATSHFFEK